VWGADYLKPRLTKDRHVDFETRRMPPFDSKIGNEMPMTTRRTPAVQKPPAYLKPETRDWINYVLSEYSLDQHHFRLLVLAAEAWDRGQEARQAIEKHGITYVDRFGAPRKRPEISVESESRVAFARILRELDLDVDPPATTSRPPPLQSNRRI
jgi:hypothetical protein